MFTLSQSVNTFCRTMNFECFGRADSLPIFSRIAPQTSIPPSFAILRVDSANCNLPRKPILSFGTAQPSGDRHFRLLEVKGAKPMPCKGSREKASAMATLICEEHLKVVAACGEQIVSRFRTVSATRWHSVCFCL